MIAVSNGLVRAALVILPLVALLAARGIVLVLGLATLGALLHPAGRSVWRRVPGWAWSLLVLLGLGLVSVLWSVNPQHSLDVALRHTLLLGAAVVLCGYADGIGAIERRQLLTWGSAAGVLFLGLYLVDGATGLALIRLVKGLDVKPGGNDHLVYQNPGTMVLALTATSYGFVVMRRFGGLAGASIVVLALLLVLGLAHTQAPGLAALLAMVGALVLPFLKARRWLPWCLAALVLAMPLLVMALLRWADSGTSLLAPGAAPHSFFHRFAIWTFALDRLWERPWLGWGLDASRSIEGGRNDVPGYPQVEMMPLHPHNGFLQVWLELGLLGALSAAHVVWRLARSIFSPPDPMFHHAALSLLLTYLTLLGFSLGLWQNWRLSALVMAVFLLRLGMQTPHAHSYR